MGVADLLSPQRIELNRSFQDKQAVLERLVELEGRGEAILDLEAFRRDMMAREAPVSYTHLLFALFLPELRENVFFLFLFGMIQGSSE